MSSLKGQAFTIRSAKLLRIRQMDALFVFTLLSFTILSTKAELFYLKPNRGKSFTGPAKG